MNKKIRIEFKGFIETDPSEVTFAYIGPFDWKPYINGLEYIKLSENEKTSYVLWAGYESLSNYDEKQEEIYVKVIE